MEQGLKSMVDMIKTPQSSFLSFFWARKEVQGLRLSQWKTMPLRSAIPDVFLDLLA